MASNKETKFRIRFESLDENDGLKKIVELLESIQSSAKETTKDLKNFTSSFKETGKTAKEVGDTAGNALRSIQDNVSKTKKGIKETNEFIKKSAKYWKQFAGRINTYLSYRVINTTLQSLKDLAKSTIDLEASFANIQAITSATDTEMGKLRNTILKVGEASKYSVEEISDATVTLGQAGLTADEINNVLETTTQLAAATGSSLQNTVDLMTSALAVWGLNSEEASHLSDVMVTGMNRTKATLETFRMAVQYAGATMASLNVNFDEFASVAAAAANAGLRASVVGTGLRAVASELISPTTKMVKGLSQLGLTTEDVNIETNGLVNVLQKLKDAGLDAGNAYNLFGRRAAQFILAAQGQLDVVNDLQLAFVESGATLKAYDTQMNTVAAEWTALANTIKEAAYKVLSETDGFLHDILVKIKNGIRKIFLDESDEIKESVKNLDGIMNTTKRYSDLLKNMKTADYGGDNGKQLDQLNNVIKSLNEVYDLNIDLANSAENIADKYDEVISKVEEYRRKSYEERNEQVKAAKEAIKDEKFKRAFGPSASAGRDAYDEAFEGYVDKLIKNENSFPILAKNIQSDYEKQLDELEKNFRGRALDIQKQYLEQYKQQEEVALSAAKSFVESDLGLKNYEHDVALEQVEKQILDAYASINNDITESFADTAENLDKFQGQESTLIKTEKDRIDGIITDFGKFIDTLSPETQDLLSEDKNLLQSKLDEYVTKLSNKLDKVSLNFINGEIKILESIPERAGEVQNLSNLSAEGMTSEFEKRAAEAKANKKFDTATKRTTRELERERAREFNKKYQNLKLQAQSDEYTQSSAEATRKGVLSKLNTRDTTGTLASYYSSTAADLSKLESLKTALSNKETLEQYKKDYGDLFQQVQSGKVNLEDADNKTAGLIKEMIDLDKSVKAAEGEFGNLNDVDLTDLNNQITTLQDKLNEIEQSSETEFGKLKEGFKATIKSMSDSYGSAKLGSMMAEDLTNGMSDALYSVADGTKSMKEAFSDMARSILQDISKMLIKMAVLKAMESGMGLFGNGGVVKGGDQLYQSVPEGSDLIQGGAYAQGGFIPKFRAALGTPVRGGVAGKDSVPAMLMPGEYVLKKSAVDALGTNFLNDLNNNAAQTLTSTASNLMQNGGESSQDSEPAVVNVWVVSKEEEAKMGPNDVIATISKDISTGGITRRLIQSVVVGRK